MVIYIINYFKFYPEPSMRQTFFHGVLSLHYYHSVVGDDSKVDDWLRSEVSKGDEDTKNNLLEVRNAENLTYMTLRTAQCTLFVEVRDCKKLCNFLCYPASN